MGNFGLVTSFTIKTSYIGIWLKTSMEALSYKGNKFGILGASNSEEWEHTPKKKKKKKKTLETTL